MDLRKENDISFKARVSQIISKYFSSTYCVYLIVVMMFR